MIKSALKNNVKKLLFISTDKVVNPSSKMGKTKLKAEKLILQANNPQKKNSTKFSIIRFGNIIGSRGSVLPKFLSQIRNNQNLTLTSKDMTRFFITIDFAVKKISRSIEIMNGSEIFIIRNMNSIKIYDLALALKKYFNFQKRIIIKGIREGEKLYEELASPKEKNFVTTNKDFFVINKQIPNKINNTFSFNSKNANQLANMQIIKFLKKSNLLNLKKIFI